MVAEIQKIDSKDSDAKKQLLKLEQAKEVAKGEKKKRTPGGVDPLLLAWQAIHKSVQISVETANINANALQTNAIDQNNVINEEAKFNFVVLQTKQADGKKIKITQKKLESVSAQNEEISAIRGFFEGQATELKQNAQQMETSENTVSDENQQSVSEASSLMQLLLQVSNQIAR